MLLLYIKDYIEDFRETLNLNVIQSIADCTIMLTDTIRNDQEISRVVK